MVNNRLVAENRDFLDADLLEQMDRRVNLDEDQEAIFRYYFCRYEDDFRNKRELEAKIKRLAKTSEVYKKIYLKQAEESMKTGRDELNKSPFAARTHFQEAATIYAKLGHHVKYAQAVSGLALSLQTSKIVDSIDTLVNYHLRKGFIKKGRGKNPKANKAKKERRRIVHKRKKSGLFQPKERWPRTKWRQYHVNVQGVRTALNLIYIKAETYLALGTGENFEAEYLRAMKILSETPPGKPKYVQALREKFDSLRPS